MCLSDKLAASGPAFWKWNCVWCSCLHCWSSLQLCSLLWVGETGSLWPLPGSVLFLPQSHRNKYSMSPKALSDPDHEELLASQEKKETFLINQKFGFVIIYESQPSNLTSKAKLELLKCMLLHNEQFYIYIYIYIYICFLVKNSVSDTRFTKEKH